MQSIGRRIHTAIERRFPEQRLFLRSDTETRFIRLSPETQLVGIAGSAVLVGWAIVASAILLMQSLGAGDLRSQALREQASYEQRLNDLAAERDARAAEAAAAQSRFSVALAEVSAMQSRLLASEELRREMETGLEAVHATLREVIDERDAEAERAASLLAQLEDAEASSPDLDKLADIETTLDFVTAALIETTGQRDGMSSFVDEAEQMLARAAFEDRLEAERNERVFTQIEDAVTASITPIEKMFAAVSLPTDSIIEQLRRSYSGQGGPLMPITFSTSGNAEVSPVELRANEVLMRLDQANLFRIAAEKLPFSHPVRGTYRFTSGFGQRWGRPHKGSDFAGSTGTPIHSTADGVVTFAGRQSGYGNLIKIRHEFGFETRYAHLNKIRVREGQRVSRGERIGDMGNTGRSTGTHLHYEVRVGGKAVNPMKYIKAARDVF